MGKEKLAALLLNEGFTCKVHDQFFQPNEEDAVWLTECGKRAWIVITPDTRIMKETSNMRAIGASRGRVFFLPDNNTKSEVWAECMKAAYSQIMATLGKFRGPFIARIGKLGSVWGIRELTPIGNDKKKPTVKKG